MSTTDDANGDEDAGRVVSVSKKGQATIPKDLREKHGISTPGKVRVSENEDGEIVVKPVSSLREFRGTATTDRSGTDLLREGREQDRTRSEHLADQNEE